MQKTTLAKKETAQRNWVVVDLDGKILGRAATLIANILRGKTKPIFTPHVDAGDFVVAINAEKVKLTGNKPKSKIYYKHTGYIGGLKETTAEKLIQRDAASVVRRAVWGMLPKNKLSRHLLRKLKIYAAAEHPHSAQQPKMIEN